MGEVLGRLVGGEGVVVGLEVLPMRAELERDYEGCEQVVSVLGKGTATSCGLHHAAGGVLFGPGCQIARQASGAVGERHGGGEKRWLLIATNGSVVCGELWLRQSREARDGRSMRLD